MVVLCLRSELISIQERLTKVSLESSRNFHLQHGVDIKLLFVQEDNTDLLANSLNRTKFAFKGHIGAFKVLRGISEGSFDNVMSGDFTSC